MRLTGRKAAVRRGAWRVHGVSVTGYRHRRDGMPCQDHWCSEVYGPPEARVTVLAVADGAGSRPFSDQGSELAAKTAVRVLGKHALAAVEARVERGPEGAPVHKLLRNALGEIRQLFLNQIKDKAGEDADPDDYASTLTAVVLAPSWIGHLSVGDGFVLLRAGEEDGTRQFHLLPQPESVSEYSNETVFLGSPDAERYARTDCVRDDDVDGVLLSTDGLAQAALKTRGSRVLGVNGSFAAGVLRPLDELGPVESVELDTIPAEDADKMEGLLSSDRLTRLNADDKTLLRAVRS